MTYKLGKIITGFNMNCWTALCTLFLSLQNKVLSFLRMQLTHIMKNLAHANLMSIWFLACPSLPSKDTYRVFEEN